MTIEVSGTQLAALVRGESISVGPSKRVITLDDGPFAVNPFEKKSYPAPHCGRPGEQGGSAPRSECSGASERDSANDLFQHIPGTKRWDAVRDALDAIDSVHEIDIWRTLPLKETRAANKGASYHIMFGSPNNFMIKLSDRYGETEEISIVHEIGHHIDHWLLGQNEPYAPRWFMATVANSLSGAGMSVSGIEDAIDRIRKYPVQLSDLVEEGEYEYIEPSDEISRAGLYLWDAIKKSQGYRDLENFKTYTGRVEIPNPPDDYFFGQRSNPDFETVKKVSEVNPIVLGVPFSLLRNFREPREIFARAYSQYVALRSGNERMILAVDENNRFAKSGSYPIAWEWDDFEPIANQFDSLFRSKR